MNNQDVLQQDSAPKNRKNKNIALWKQLTLFLVGWIGFQIIAATIQVLIYGISLASGSSGSMQEVLGNTTMSMIINSLAYISLAGALFGILNVDTIKLTKSFASWKPYVAAIICVISIYVFNLIWSNIIALVDMPASDNMNQASIETIEKSFPFASLVIFGFIGPICEEVTYRVGLFSLCKRRSRELAYMVTIIVFAFIHFNLSRQPLTLLNEILNLPYYAFAAAAFSFVYDKFGFASSVTAHITNNLISLIISIIR